MAQLLELAVNAVIGWVPDRPRWAMWLVVTAYIGIAVTALALAAAAVA